MMFFAYLAAVVTWIANLLVVLIIIIYIQKNGVGWLLLPLLFADILLYLLLIFERRYIIKHKAGRGKRNTGDGTMCSDNTP